MRIKITKPGIFANNGVETAVGTELDVRDEPTAWAGRYEVISGGGGKTAVVNPKTGAPKPPFGAKDKGQGWWGIFDADGVEVGKSIRKDDAEVFNAASDEDRLAFVTSAQAAT